MEITQIYNSLADYAGFLDLPDLRNQRDIKLKHKAFIFQILNNHTPLLKSIFNRLSLSLLTYKV